MSRIITTEELLAVSGYAREGDVCRMLDEHGIRYFLGKGARPWTTLDLINAAGGLRYGELAERPDLYSPDDV
jgi:hypothetical protein